MRPSKETTTIWFSTFSPRSKALKSSNGFKNIARRDSNNCFNNKLNHHHLRPQGRPRKDLSRSQLHHRKAMRKISVEMELTFVIQAMRRIFHHQAKQLEKAWCARWIWMQERLKIFKAQHPIIIIRNLPSQAVRSRKNIVDQKWFCGRSRLMMELMTTRTPWKQILIAITSPPRFQRLQLRIWLILRRNGCEKRGKRTVLRVRWILVEITSLKAKIGKCPRRLHRILTKIDPVF